MPPPSKLQDEPGSVLVVDDHAQARDSIAEVLRHAGHRVDCCSSAVEALQRLEQRNAFDLVITDLRMPGMSGLQFIERVAQRRLTVQIAMITAHASVGTAVQAMRQGAFDYIEKPFSAEQLEELTQRALQHGRILAKDDTLPGSPAQDRMMIGSSAPMQALRERIALVAPTCETVLLGGETGTGKEVVARAIHAASSRAAEPLVSLNCPVLSEHLLESELFGHRKGAFTGADDHRVGRFQLADGGTILLDEITEIDLPLQAKLLRVLQEKSFEPVGSSETISTDVRVLATTNRDLHSEVGAGRFREDLYYRLNVLPISVPPLRDRREDIPALIEHFMARAATRLGHAPAHLDAATLALLQDYHWPGNVRELENIVTRVSVLSQAGSIAVDDVRRWLIDAGGAAAGAHEPPAHGELPVGVSLQEMERRLIESTLEHFGGHRAKTAEALGIGLRTLTGKLRSYGYAPREKSFAKAG